MSARTIFQIKITRADEEEICRMELIGGGPGGIETSLKMTLPPEVADQLIGQIQAALKEQP